MSATIKIENDEKGKCVDPKLYRGLINSLLYLTISRLDIHFGICLCARFQSCPKKSHLITIKRIFKYLIGTHSIGLQYPRNESFELVGYSDLDFTRSRLDRKITLGTCQFLSHSLVSWHSMKQTSVVLSIAEIEYIDAESCVAQILQIKQQVKDFELK